MSASVQIWMAWQQRGGATDVAVTLHVLLLLMAGPRVGLRSGRILPRARNRGPKPYPRLMQPRKAAQQQIRLHGHPEKQC